MILRRASSSAPGSASLFGAGPVSAAPPGAAPAPRGLALVLVLALCALLPVLLSPEIPPLDLSNHLGRAYILAHHHHSPGLRALYDVLWAPTPNLAADLLLTPLVLVFGPRPAVRLFAGLSLLAMAGAFAAVSRACRGRWERSALLGLPLAHGLAFNYGFINYYWGVAAALFSFACWLRRDRGPGAALLMILLGHVTYLMHLVGLGALLVAMGASIAAIAVLERGEGLPWGPVLRRALADGAVLLLVALGPALLYLGYSRGAVGGAGLHRGLTWTGPWDKLLGVLRVLRAGRLGSDAPLLGLCLALGLVGLRQLRAEVAAARGGQVSTTIEGGGAIGSRLACAAGGAALLLLGLLMPGAFDLETSDVDLRVALPALLLLLAALPELPGGPAVHRAALGLLVACAALRGLGAAAEWRRASAGITDSRALCPALPAGARVTTLHNEVPRPGEVEHGAGERHGWAYCLFDRPLFFPALFHVAGSQPLRLRLPAYEGSDTVAHYHLKNGFSNPSQAREIPWSTVLQLSDYLWLTGWDLAEADPLQQVPRRCLEEVGRRPRVVVYRLRRELSGCKL